MPPPLLAAQAMLALARATNAAMGLYGALLAVAAMLLPPLLAARAMLTLARAMNVAMGL
ncbi:hypothetical protein [Solilutibacter pythonis]|uniref:hypothetical protein n=1 Tax=Solilutibacter pythonis TaxID=2483112 RepID=UPI001314DCC6|nr:hypothetical protein [Lysobacter pythonis]